MTLISPSNGKELKFSIYRANSEQGFDYYLRCDEEFATLKNRYPNGMKFALSVVLTDSKGVSSLPIVVFIRFVVPGVT